MEDTLSIQQLRDMFLYIAQKVIDSENFLTEIDSKIGDGDHGFGMALGFKAVSKELEGKSFNTVEEIFQTVGMTLLDTMGGASGVLFGTMFISGVVNQERHENADLSILASVFRRSLEAIKRRGRANVGDKTMVDALEPAVMGLEEGVKNGLSLKKGLQMAAEGAKKGVECTKQYIARFGRAKSYGAKSLGVPDAGATSVWIIFQAMADWTEKNIK